MAPLTLRSIGADDAPALAEVLFAASYHDALRAGTAPPLEDARAARDAVALLARLDPAGGMVAERDGAPVAVGWAHARGRVCTIGPLAVAPAWRGRDLGTRVLAALLERYGPAAAQVRMLDAGLGTTALALALRAGFHVVAPVLGLVLPPGAEGGAEPARPPARVRPATAADRAAVIERDARSFGARRAADVDDALRAGRLLVAEDGGALAGYALGAVVGRTLLVGAAAADDPALVLALVAAQRRLAEPGNGAVRLAVPAGDQRLVEGFLRAGYRVERLHAYLARGGGTVPPRNYVLMPLGRC